MKTIFYTAFIIFCTASSQAQYYDFTSFNIDYYESDNWTSVSNGEVWDDPAYEIPLPWNFQFYGETIDKIYVTENGYGADLATKPYSENEEATSLIIPLYADIIDRGYNNDQSLSEIRYTTEVTADNELFIIEWHNVGFYNEIAEGGTGESYISFQVIFNRNFNAIAMSYGESNIVDPDNVYDGNTGPSVCLVENLDFDPTTPVGEAVCLVGDPNNPSTQSINTDEEDAMYLMGNIPENKFYLFSVNESVPTANLIKSEEVNIYPSPAINEINIDSEIDFESYRLISIMGNVMQSASLKSTRLDLSNLISGVYILELVAADGSMFTKQIIKR